MKINEVFSKSLLNLSPTGLALIIHHTVSVGLTLIQEAVPQNTSISMENNYCAIVTLLCGKSVKKHVTKKLIIFVPTSVDM